MDEIFEVSSKFSSKITAEDAGLCALGGWFDVHFKVHWAVSTEQNPAKQEVELTTALSVEQGTHWGQQVFLLHPPVNLFKGDELNVSIEMIRSKENYRLMEVYLNCELKMVSGKPLQPIRKKFFTVSGIVF